MSRVDLFPMGATVCGLPNSHLAGPEIDHAGVVGIDEERIQRLWVGTRRRREVRKTRVRAVVVVALALMIPAVILSRMNHRPTFLRLSDGTLPLSRQVDVGTPQQLLSFEEGSSIRLLPGSRLVPVRNDASLFETEMGAAAGRQADESKKAKVKRQNGTNRIEDLC